MTTTPAPTDLDQVRARHEVALRWLREGYSYDDNFNQAALLIRDDVPALLDELAKTRAELTRAEQRARMATQHARRCDAQVADADAEVARLQSWLADERAKWLRHQAEDHPVDVEANPAATAEPAAHEVTLAEAAQHAINVTLDAEQRRVAQAEREAERYRDQDATAEPADEDELVPHVEPVSAATIAGMAAMSHVRNREVFAPWDDDEPADEPWRDFTIHTDWGNEQDVYVACRLDDVCEEVKHNPDGTLLTLGEAVDWAKEHAASPFHAEPAAS